MKNISFSRNVLPHLVAVIIFLVVTVLFFSQVFFENKSLDQHDITQSIGASKVVADYRKQTGEEALWVPNMFSGMPAYLVSVEWSVEPLAWTKRFLGVGLPHPVNNIFIAFVCYYIMLLAFRVRPYLAIAGALAFGLSSYLIIGLAAGHNARIGAIAFMPLVMAGIHLAFTGKRLLGFAITTTALALHLRENHLQITYYLVLIVLVYGVVTLVFAVRNRQLADVAKTLSVLVIGALLAAGTFFGPLWAINEYSKYSIRGKSELIRPETSATPAGNGLARDYAFQYSNGILEPLTLVIPNFYGGASSDNLMINPESKVRKALSAQGIQYDAQQMGQGAYWGSQPLSAPYYGGAIIFFLFVMGIFMGDRKLVWWLVPLSVLAIVLSWGSNLPSVNYFLFDHLPGYNKFRSVTFIILIVLFAMPLLGCTALEKLMATGLTAELKKKLQVAALVAGGLCFALILAAGLFSFIREGEETLPAWFIEALRADRKGLMRADAFRSLAFMTGIFVLIYFNVYKKAPAGFFAVLIFFTAIDLIVVDRRYFTKQNFVSNRKARVDLSEGDQQVLRDKGHFRVLNFSGTMNEALTSYYHNSLGGYHGAKLRRYQDLYDSCLEQEMVRLGNAYQTGQPDVTQFPVLNMLNTKYIMYGNNRASVIPYAGANGPAWFIQEVIEVQNPTEELLALRTLNTKRQAVVDASAYTVKDLTYDSSSTVNLLEHRPNYLKYEAQTATRNLAVFSEIHYPHGWQVTLNGTPVPLLRINYVLRGVEIPAGKHVVEFTFAPDAYRIGNPVTAASCWLVVLILLGALGWNFYRARTSA
jgi:hypothetical protein